MTTLELLDAVEDGIAALRARGTAGNGPAQSNSEAAAALRAELKAGGISAVEFARAASVPQHEVEEWAAGVSPVPEWVPAAMRLMSLLTPSARRKLFYGPADSQVRPANCHPFARIEEL